MPVQRGVPNVSWESIHKDVFEDENPTRNTVFTGFYVDPPLDCYLSDTPSYVILTRSLGFSIKYSQLIILRVRSICIVLQPNESYKQGALVSCKFPTIFEKEKILIINFIESQLVNSLKWENEDFEIIQSINLLKRSYKQKSSSNQFWADFKDSSRKITIMPGQISFEIRVICIERWENVGMAWPAEMIWSLCTSFIILVSFY